ncbi:multicopper oxidase domain-containing protein [Sanyastnella coralliicola]|uniref:multicopper oxidase domain-containing protein n=1 Tax=Sanyastnella coralliicola TaxID=3069118 RepID=UPI0027BAB73F|nr:multicopper oxidase domain-containing protein [Longitalea sp. SCSIO 12813]
MKIVSLLVGLCLSFTVSHGQTVVELFSGMDGFLLLDTGSPTQIWGYGYIDEGTYTIPAPELTFDLNDDIELYFENWSPEAHTIHLHGLDVDQANDGVPQTSFQVTQGENATYSFETTHPGTYLYHCHVTTTLHLTMGMYGMIVVNYNETQAYEGSPAFDREFRYLMSDLEIETNDAPNQAFPFHEIYPDYFMINGKSGDQITNTPSLSLSMEEGETGVVRFGSMAYSKLIVDIPEELNAVVHMSDGRVVPQTFGATELEIFPGERFTVFVDPDPGFEEDILVSYYSMLNNELEGVNTIPVTNLSNSVEESSRSSLEIYPNPSSGVIQLKGAEGNFVITDLHGKVVYVLNSTVKQHDLSHLNSGTYFLLDLDRKNSAQKLIIK